MKSSILLLLLGVSSLFLVWEMLLTSGKSMNLVFIAIVNSSLFKNFSEYFKGKEKSRTGHQCLSNTTHSGFF